ncbi:MarR family transcriptional regulator [Salinimonas marina]|uniref:MarR family transcriptional regulator n=1 Tax=Salinimonas marina TaxID=2785918 RepID=A0A7S9HCF9_9ALTE|nr:MarR family transcriptional regulator [Salinimonas marina]QPG04837.1 MarR family transcriptional regulator [Salinimonas marina]
MKLNDALFELMFAVRSTTLSKIKSLHPELSPMHFKALKLTTKISECTGQKVAEKMGRDKAQINRLLKELVEKGLLYKTENANDKRSQLLNLTDDGKKIIASFEKVENEINQLLVKDITSDELATFIHISEKLKTSLEANTE